MPKKKKEVEIKSKPSHVSVLEIAKWHEVTFPDTTLAGQKAKIKEEKREWAKSNCADISELADIYIVSCGLTRFDSAEAMMGFHYVEEQCMFWGIFHQKLLIAVDKKMQINYNRVWKATPDGAYHHM